MSKILLLSLIAAYSTVTTNAFVVAPSAREIGPTLIYRHSVATMASTELKTAEGLDLGDVPADVLSTATEATQTVDVPAIEAATSTQGGLDLDVVALVAGQETYGLAIVCVGEAIWSFLQAPSFDNVKVLIAPIISAIVLAAVAGPMVTSGDAASVSIGLEIATLVSLGLGASYVLRLLSPYSPVPKEIAFLGLLVALAGFFSFGQNLIVDGFITLPSLPSIPLPQIEFPTLDLEF
jgi:uncharacterized membrane protein (UPF0136 family)